MTTPSLWKANPSPLAYLGRFIGLVLVYIFYRYTLSEPLTDFYKYADIVFLILITLAACSILLEIFTTSYELQFNRLIIKKGIIVQKRDMIELYRLKDYTLISPLGLRILGVSHMRIISSDKTHPDIKLIGLRNGESKMDQLRELVENARKIKGVREFD